MAEYIPDFKAKLQETIDRHHAEAARLTRWMEGLNADGFNWEEVTEAQAWAIWKLDCTEDMAEQEASK